MPDYSSNKKGKKMTDDNIKNVVLEQFKKASEFKKPWDQRAVEMYALFRSVVDEPSAQAAGHLFKGRSRVVDPEANRVVETITARIARGATVGYGPQETGDFHRAKALTQVAKYYLRKARFNVLSRLWVKEALITGTGFIKVTWEKETSWVTRRVPKLVLKIPGTDRELVRFGTKIISEEEIQIDRPKVEVLDFADVFVHPEATGPHFVPAVFHKFKATKEMLKKNPNYDPKKIDKIAAYKEGQDTENVVEGSEDYRQQRYDHIDAVLPPCDGEFHNGLEGWLHLDLDGSGFTKPVVVTIVGGEVIRAETNPFFNNKPPIIAYRPIPVPHEYYGMSILEATASMYHALNAIRRQRIDAGTLALNPILTVLRGANVDVKSLISRPGAKWFMDDPNGVQAIKMPDPSSFSYVEIKDLKRDIRDATGATEFISGGDNLSDRTTATEFVGKVEQSNVKFRFMLDMFEEEALMDFGDQLVDLIQQYMSSNVPVRLTGKDGIEEELMVRPKDILGRYDIITETEASAVGDKQAQFNKLTQGYNTLIGSPYINPVALTRKYMTEGLEWKDVEELLVDPAKGENEAKNKQLQVAMQENSDPTIAQVRPDEDHKVHLDVHDAFIRSEAFNNLHPDEQEMLVRHRQEHAYMLNEEMGNSNERPVKTSMESEQMFSPPGAPKATPEEMQQRGPGRPPLQSKSNDGQSLVDDGKTNNRATDGSE